MRLDRGVIVRFHLSYITRWAGPCELVPGLQPVSLCRFVITPLLFRVHVALLMDVGDDGAVSTELLHNRIPSLLHNVFQ